MNGNRQHGGAGTAAVERSGNGKAGGERWRQETEALLQAAEELNGASDPEQILFRLVAIAARLIAVERVAIATNEGDHARRRYVWDDDVRRSLAG
jgi:hypothetical protein